MVNGFTGTAWLLQHLINIDFLEQDFQETLDEMDEYILKSTAVDKEDKNYDLLYGIIGKGVYFLERYPLGLSQQALEQIVLILESISIQTPTGISWKDHFTQDTPLGVNGEKYNLGLAHGVPSIIIFLSMVLQKNILKHKTVTMLEGAVNWLLKEEHETALSCYASTSFSTDPSRLAWCYGDLGIALSLYHASIALNNESLKDKAKSIALKASKRNLFNAHIFYDETLKVVDSGICHGASGIAHVFNKFYKYFNLLEFKSTADYWLAQTIEGRSKKGRGVAGFLKYDSEMENGISHKVWTGDSHLLNGVAGVGLVALSHISNEELLWDRCLLLS